ncbi:WD40 repeat domain-containing protein, partial [Mesorhizobium sp. M1C.F.Ca.ET.195.01.1.1]
VAPDGRSIMSASTDRTIKLWDIGGKHLIRNLGVHKDMARTALYMPDGISALTAGDDGEIVQRKLADGAVLHVFQSGQNGGVNKLAISPDGKHAVSGHDTGNVIIWDLVNGSAQ